MSNTPKELLTEFSVKTYYIKADVFNRPIEFQLYANYNTQEKAKQAFEAAFHPCKVVDFITPHEGLSFMQSAGVFNEFGNRISRG